MQTLSITCVAFLLFLQTPALKLSPPVQGMRVIDLRDTFHEKRDGHEHEATDILAPRGTPVRAVAPGIIQKLFLSKPGGKTIYQFDESGEYCYYYAHLDAYAEGLRDGQRVGRGEVIGFVGSTGNADPSTPHLHFTIFQLGNDKRWWKGTAIDPFPYLRSALVQ